MIISDLPITCSADDKLGRQSFAENLAQVLLHASFLSSFSVGLYGSWGSGKTSLLNMVIEQVESKSDDIIVLRFNPWLCSDPKQLITQFFKQLASAIKIKKPTADTICDLVNQYAEIFDAATIIPYVGPAIVAVLKAFTSKARKRINRKSNDLQGIKDQIICKMKEEDIRIIVTIDDIDRLSEEEIIAVFQLVKALADFPNAVYLLAFDYDVVVHALATVQHGDGREYLEKLIQVPFEIPTPNIACIQNALFSNLNEILGDISDDKWDKTAWARLFQFGIQVYIKSIRDVIRYSNVFYLKYQLLQDETDPVDLLGLTCLQVFEPAVYSLLNAYKDMLCGSINSYSYEHQSAEEEKIKKAVDAIFSLGVATNEEAAKKILGILFPKMNSAFGNAFSASRYYDHRKFLIHCNIAAPECFDRYFSLSLEENAIPSAIMRKIMFEASESELLIAINQLYQNGKIVRMLEEIEAYANHSNSKSISSERAALLIRCLCKEWGSFEVEEVDFYAIPFKWRLLYCFEPLLGSIEAAKQYPFLQELFEDKEVEPSTLATLLQDLEEMHGRFTDKGAREDMQMIALDELLKLEPLFKARCIEAVNSGAAFSHYGSLNFLWLLNQIDENLGKQIKETLVTDDTSLAKVISYCTSHGKIAATFVEKTRQVSHEKLGEFIDVKDAHKRMSTFVTTREFLQLPEDNQMDTVTFLISMNKIAESSPAEGRFTEEDIKNELQKLASAIQ